MDWIDHDAEPNGIGSICRFCHQLIDSHPHDHAPGCKAREGDETGADWTPADRLRAAISHVWGPEHDDERVFLRAHIREAERAVAQCERDVTKYKLDLPEVVHKLASAQAELRAAWELLPPTQEGTQP